jgi:replicative DNA helicase
MDGSAPDLSAAITPERIPPHDLDAEAAVLSALFLSPGLTVELKPEHFYADANAWIFRAIRATPAPTDIVLVAAWLRDQKRLYQVGGTPYLAQIVDATPCVANVAAHAAIVRECWRRRVLIAAFQQVTAELYHGLSADEAWRTMKEKCNG